MSQASALEQYMLELVNAERKKVGRQPLAFDGDLNEAADAHSKFMIAVDKFAHEGIGDGNPGDRIQAAGYKFTPPWTWGENIAWMSYGPGSFDDEVLTLHKNLMNSPGHKANILDATYREVGIGIQMGDYQGWDGIFATQAFAKTGTDLFITGVAFRDKDGDHAYDPGEGLGGLGVKAVGGGSTVTGTTGSAGGYDLALEAGTYTVTFSGGGISPVTRTVTVGGMSVKVDLVDPVVVPGVSKVGTAAANALSGGAGGDTLKGLAGNDTLSGKAGNDRLYGGDGVDKLVGSTGRDLLQGDGGNDLLYGGADADVFRFVGAFGNDKVYDFRQGDRMDLRGHGLTFEKLTIAQRDLDKDGTADDVLVRMPGHTLSLLNVKLATIDKGDFMF